MHSVEDMLVEKNYSKCPLKKRPVNYQFEDPEPQDLCVKKLEITEEEEEEEMDHRHHHRHSSSEELINVSDCCEDEGVDVDHTDEEMEMEEDEEDEDVDVDVDSDANQTQAAALAAAAAVAAVASAASVSASAVPGSVIMPTPTYPKYPWSFHMSPYTAEFYRTINHPGHQISPLRGDLMAPSSPSDSLGSLSPPPHHYLHGRASSVSPPMRSEIIHRPIGVRQHHHHQHRFLPYPPMPSYPALAGGYHHHAPISPAYSENSYYSMRSMTPESSCSSSLPEDLSLKHLKKTLKSSTTQQSELLTPIKAGDVSASSSASSPSSSLATAAAPGSSNKNKDKSQPPRYQCPDCQKSYSTFSGLTKHQQFHCPAAEGNQVKKSFSCKDCDKTYVSLGALKMHIRTHTLPCKCNLCGKAFSRPRTHPHPHGGEALQLPALPSGLCRSLQPAGPPADALGHQEVLLQQLLQDLLADVAAHQALGGRLSWWQCQRRRWRILQRAVLCRLCRALNGEGESSSSSQPERSQPCSTKN
ncbi:hypothetical protein KR038_011247 [Drosophila bunnanda]|nr:hypothetical protein KR038_011247 [Drosophila bunnanda]